MIAQPGWALIESEEKKKMGILELPDSAKAEIQQGTIISIGAFYYKDGVLNKSELVEGDKVVYKKYHDSEFEIEGKKYKGVEIEKIIAKLN